jgi:hypothetical protein
MRLKIKTAMLWVALMTAIFPTLAAGQAAASAQKAMTDSGSTYRLDFVLTEFESGKKVNTRSYQMVLHSNGARQSARVGSRVPIATGAGSMQFQYMDIGVNIDARLRGPDDDLSLEGNIEVSGITMPAAGADAVHSNPVVRQSKVSFDSAITMGKAITVASLDEVDGPRRLQIDVTATRMK